MWSNAQLSADLVIFTEEILNGKLHFLCSDTLDKKTRKVLASWMFRIVFPFVYQKVELRKVPETLKQYLYECISYS